VLAGLTLWCATSQPGERARCAKQGALAGRGPTDEWAAIPAPVCGHGTCSLETLIGSLVFTGPKVSTA
jgi:hypothetical protein